MRFWAKVEIQKLIELLLKDFKRQAAPFGLQVTTLWGRDNIKAIVSAWSVITTQAPARWWTESTQRQPLSMDIYTLLMGTAPLAMLGLPHLASQTAAMTEENWKRRGKTCKVLGSDFNHQTGLRAHVNMMPISC